MKLTQREAILVDQPHFLGAVPCLLSSDLLLGLHLYRKIHIYHTQSRYFIQPHNQTHSKPLHAWGMHWRMTSTGVVTEVAFWCCLKILVQHERPTSTPQGCMTGDQRCFQKMGTNNLTAQGSIYTRKQGVKVLTAIASHQNVTQERMLEKIIHHVSIYRSKCQTQTDL